MLLAKKSTSMENKKQHTRTKRIINTYFVFLATGLSIDLQSAGAASLPETGETLLNG